MSSQPLWVTHHSMAGKKIENIENIEISYQKNTEFIKNLDTVCGIKKIRYSGYIQITKYNIYIFSVYREIILGITKLLY